MWKKSVSLWLLLAVSLIMTSCGNGGQAQGPAQPDYKSVKDMVLDILQTEEAKNSVAKMMKDDKFTQNLIMDESTVKTTLIKALPTRKMAYQRSLQRPEVCQHPG